jgi:hypothetical protein
MSFVVNCGEKPMLTRLSVFRIVSIATLFFLCTTSNLLAKSWKGATPGVTSKKQILLEFGKPTQEFSKGGKFSNGINYQGEQAIKGSLETNFFFDKNDVLFQIDVFPTKKISKKQVIKIFGKDYKEKLTKKGHSYFNYWKTGMVIFFEKEKDQVLSFMFTEEPKSNAGKTVRY